MTSPLPAGRFATALSAVTGVAARASNQLVLLAVTLVATRFLGPAQFGVFTIAAACTTLVRTLLYSGPFEYLLKAKDATNSSTESLIVNFGVASLFSIALAVLAMFASRLFGSADLGVVIAAMIPSNFFASVTAWQEVHILRAGRVKLYYLLTFLTECASGAVAIILLFGHWGLGALIAQTYARAICMGLAYRLIQKPTFSPSVSVAEVRRIVAWSRTRYLNVFVNFGYAYGADFVLTAFFSTAAAGLYRASDRIVTAVSDVVEQPTRTISMILFSKRIAADRATTDLWPKVLLTATVVSWPALVGLASVSSSLVPILLGPRWSAAGAIVSIICLQRAVSIVNAVTNPLLVTHNRQHVILATQTAASLATLAGLVVFARFGVPAAAWTIAAVGAVATTCQFVVVIRLFPGSRAAVFENVAVAALPTAATALAVHACLVLAPGLGIPGKWLLAGFTISGGVIAWLLAASAVRGRLSRSVLALGE